MSTRVTFKTHSEMLFLPLSERMRHVKAALTVVGYAVVGYTPQGAGNLIIRVKTHAKGGPESVARPPSVFAGKRRAST